MGGLNNSVVDKQQTSNPGSEVSRLQGRDLINAEGRLPGSGIGTGSAVQRHGGLASHAGQCRGSQDFSSDRCFALR